MPQDPTIFTLDAQSISKGGEKGGLYLDMLGKTDLATLSSEEWQDFCTYMVEGAFRHAMDRHIANIDGKEPRTPRQGRPIGDNEVPF